MRTMRAVASTDLPSKSVTTVADVEAQDARQVAMILVGEDDDLLGQLLRLDEQPRHHRVITSARQPSSSSRRRVRSPSSR